MDGSGMAMDEWLWGNGWYRKVGLESCKGKFMGMRLRKEGGTRPW